LKFSQKRRVKRIKKTSSLTVLRKRTDKSGEKEIGEIHEDELGKMRGGVLEKRRLCARKKVS